MDREPGETLEEYNRRMEKEKDWRAKISREEWNEIAQVMAAKLNREAKQRIVQQALVQTVDHYFEFKAGYGHGRMRPDDFMRQAATETLRELLKEVLKENAEEVKKKLAAYVLSAPAERLIETIRASSEKG